MKIPSNQTGVFEPIQDIDSDCLGRYQFARRIWKRVSAPDCSSAVGLYGGILANFTEKEQQTTDPVPLSDRFTEDQALKHYLNQCFMQEPNPDVLRTTLVACMTWLREVGLP